jgi:hypothetical protein
VQNTKAIVFYKFRHTWVLPTQGRTPRGLLRHIDPVILVDEADVKGLIQAIQQQLQNQPNIGDEPAAQRQEMIAAQALNLSPRAFHAEARAFEVVADPQTIALSEWKRAKGLTFTTPALWEKEFRADQLDELVWFLVTRDSGMFPPSTMRAGGSVN